MVGYPMVRESVVGGHKRCILPTVGNLQRLEYQPCLLYADISLFSRKDPDFLIPVRIRNPKSELSNVVTG
jgi:hypothetical protein